MTGWAEIAFAAPVTRWIVGGVVAVVALAAAIIGGLSATGRIGPALRRELWLRLFSWCWLLPLMIGPVLIGREAVILAVTLLSLLCLREYDRATGLFREHVIVAVMVLGILAVNFAALDHWYAFFVALWPLTATTIAVASIPADAPQGYIQRTALGMLGFMLFGAGLAHLSYMANDPGYRPVLLMLMMTVALSDVAAFTTGKLIGGPKLLPATSPNKTISGALGALTVTTLLVATLTSAIYPGTNIDQWHWLLILGVLVGIGAQAGDLMLSSIKRDLGIKDMGTVLPGHGGVLDRFNSLLLVAPVAFHFIQYFIGWGLNEPTRLYTGP